MMFRSDLFTVAGLEKAKTHVAVAVLVGGLNDGHGARTIAPRKKRGMKLAIQAAAGLVRQGALQPRLATHLSKAPVASVVMSLPCSAPWTRCPPRPIPAPTGSVYQFRFFRSICNFQSSHPLTNPHISQLAEKQ